MVNYLRKFVMRRIWLELDMGHNNLTGPIHSTLFLLTKLTYVNLQFNRLSDLHHHLHLHNRNPIRRKNKRAELTSGEIKSQDRDAFSIWSCDGRIAFEEIIRATEDFDIKYCIGTGCYGSVYKARLPSGRIWFRTGEICFLQKFPEWSACIVQNSTSKHCEILWFLFAQKIHVFDLSVHGVGKLVLCFAQWWLSYGVGLDYVGEYPKACGIRFGLLTSWLLTINCPPWHFK